MLARIATVVTALCLIFISSGAGRAQDLATAIIGVWKVVTSRRRRVHPER